MCGGDAPPIPDRPMKTLSIVSSFNLVEYPNFYCYSTQSRKKRKLLELRMYSKMEPSVVILMLVDGVK